MSIDCGLLPTPVGTAPVPPAFVAGAKAPEGLVMCYEP